MALLKSLFGMTNYDSEINDITDKLKAQISKYSRQNDTISKGNVGDDIFKTSAKNAHDNLIGHINDIIDFYSKQIHVVKDNAQKAVLLNAYDKTAKLILTENVPEGFAAIAKIKNSMVRQRALRLVLGFYEAVITLFWVSVGAMSALMLSAALTMVILHPWIAVPTIAITFPLGVYAILKGINEHLPAFFSVVDGSYFHDSIMPTMDEKFGRIAANLNDLKAHMDVYTETVARSSASNTTTSNDNDDKPGNPFDQEEEETSPLNPGPSGS